MWGKRRAQDPPRTVEPQPTECDCEAFDRLEEAVSQPAFLNTLETAVQSSKAPEQAARAQADVGPLGEDPLAGAEVVDAPDAASSTRPSSTGPAAQPPEFEVIQRQDAVDAMAFYIAQCLAQHPEAKNLSPRQLQDALSLALKGLKQSRFKQLCSLGRHVYRWTTLSYSALQMYQNPWLIQAILTAIWTLSRLSLRAVAA